MAIQPTSRLARSYSEADFCRRIKYAPIASIDTIYATMTETSTHWKGEFDMKDLHP